MLRSYPSSCCVFAARFGAEKAIKTKLPLTTEQPLTSPGQLWTPIVIGEVPPTSLQASQYVPMQTTLAQYTLTGCKLYLSSYLVHLQRGFKSHQWGAYRE